MTIPMGLWWALRLVLVTRRRGGYIGSSNARSRFPRVQLTEWTVVYKEKIVEPGTSNALAILDLFFSQSWLISL